MEKYSVGRAELLQWINETLQLCLTKIEQTSNGAVACQLLDVMSPGSVNLTRVDFNAKDEYTSINNYKVLQAGFNKLGIDKPIDVSKLIKARPLDNIEFMQWFKGYFGARDRSPTDYDPIARREASKTGDIKGLKKMVSLKKPVPTGGTSTGSNTPKSVTRTQKSTFRDAPSRTPRLDRRSSDFDEQQRIDVEVEADFKNTIDMLERERDFYFDKLREIELLCQNEDLAQNPVLKFIERILYATDEREAKEAMLEAQNLSSTPAS